MALELVIKLLMMKSMAIALRPEFSMLLFPQAYYQ